MTELDLDWVHAPAGHEEVSLWSCLHDASIESVTSDHAQQNAVLTMDVFYLREHQGLGEDARFLLCFEEVEVLRVLTLSPLPPAAEVARGEDGRRWREESCSWKLFEKLAAVAQLTVSDAAVLRGSKVALRISAYAESGAAAYALAIRARTVTVRRNDGTDVGLDAFLAMGEAYWDDFEKRRST